MNSPFHKFYINGNLFETLESNVAFEESGKGRYTANLVNCFNENNKEKENIKIPIVRTTSKYKLGYQNMNKDFNDILLEIYLHIAKTFFHSLNNNSKLFTFNNAMSEIYLSNYRKMGFHSDQSLDLLDGSYIAIYSCYNTESYTPRTLVTKNKETNEITKYIMDQDSVILFNTETNKKYLHKIILDKDTEKIGKETEKIGKDIERIGKEIDKETEKVDEKIIDKEKSKEEKWMGITFRCSKTFVEKIDNKSFIDINGKKTPLRLANKDEQLEFIKLKGQENKSTNFKYPDINYTISEHDLLNNYIYLK